METIDIKSLEEAVILFYRSNSQEQAATHDWLTKVQSSPQAWSFSWELLRPEKSQEVQFFGAITLHSKLMKFWHEVPEENHAELKHKLLEAIITFSNGPKIVLNRLCIALSAFIAHMLPEWPTAIEDVISTFKVQQIPNVSTNMQLWIMLEVLQAIPEEANANFASVKRVAIRYEIAKRAPVVMQTIEDYLEHQIDIQWTEADFGNLIRAVKCIGAWVKNVGYQIDQCHKLCELIVKIVNKCYWSCIRNADGDGCMSADENDLAESCVKTLITIMIQAESHHYPKSAFILMKLFLDSLTDITESEWKENNNNEDIVVNIYTLLISSIERHSKLLLSGITTIDTEHANLYRRIINEILKCTNKPGIYPVEESCSNLAMGFWYMLQDEVFSLQDIEEKNRCWEMIKPLYAHLTPILVRKAQQPDENSMNRWNSDDLETFRCYRQDVSDTLMYCYEVLHGSMLDILSVLLQDALCEIEPNPTSWIKLEACIFAFYSVAEHIETEENNQIAKLMQVLAEIPYEKMNDKLLGTALETIGAYCFWFDANPNYIPSAIGLLIKGLNSPMCSQATLGLKDLCRDCQVKMKPYAEFLLSACQTSLSGGRLKNSDCVRLMFSIGKLMSMLPPTKIFSYLNVIVSPCFEELQVICQNGVKSPPAKIRTVFQLNMISTLFQSLNINLEDEESDKTDVQPVLMVMQKTMPLFKQVAQLWIEENEVVEAACNALKYAITNLGADFKPMLEDLCYFIISIFQNKICPPALEISKTCIVIFYKDEDSKALMQQLLVELVFHIARLFDQIPESGLSNIAEIIETYYGCIVNVIKKHPVAFSNANIDLNKLIFHALKAITLPENGPIKNGIQFLSHLIMQSRSYPDITQVVLNTGEEILRTVILCVGCHTPRQQIEKFADIFLSMNKKYPSELVTWMKILGTADFPTPFISEIDKMKFMSQIVREKVNKRLVQSYLSEFAAKSRGLIEKI